MASGKDIVATAVKGIVASVPGPGGLIAEFIGYAQEKTLAKRQQEMLDLINVRLNRLQDRIDELASNEFCVTIAQKTYSLGLQAHTTMRREQFANMLYNSFVGIEIDKDQQLMFVRLLDQLTPAAVALLNYLSVDHYKEEDYIHKNGSMCTVYVQPGTEHFLEYLANTDKTFSNHQYTKNLLNQLIQNQLIEEIDTTVPNYPQKNKAKHTTELGDNFLRYIEFK